MGSWCAASKHPWRHAQKFGGILQPRHLARVCCSEAATRELLAVSAEPCSREESSCSPLGQHPFVSRQWKSSRVLWGCNQCSHSRSLCNVPSLSFPGQWQGETAPGAGTGVRSISLPSREGVQCRPLALVSPEALGTRPGLEPHPRMSQLGAASQHPGDSRWDTTLSVL